MRSADFEIIRVNTVAEAIARLEVGSVVVAGGQSLLHDMRQRRLQPKRLVDISRIGNLAYVRADNDGLTVGAGVTLADLCDDRTVNAHCRALAQAASLVGDVQVRTRATAVGNICGTWSPTGWSVDIGVVLAASRGHVVACGPSGQRVIDAASFLSANQLPLEPGEMITAIRFGLSQSSAYARLSRRYADAAIGSAAVCVSRTGSNLDVGLAFGQVHSHVVRAPEVERSIVAGGIDSPEVDHALAAFAASLAPPDTAHAGSEYRREILPVIAKRALREAFSHIEGGK